MIKQTVLAIAISALSSMALTAHASNLNELARAAQSGDVVSQIQLGSIYANGQEGMQRSYTEALRWFHMAAEQGSPLAQYNLALLFEHGLGTERSLADAAIWYQRAANMGHPGAQLNLGYMYEHGLGVTENKTKAKELYTSAANSGDQVAQHNLGLMLVSEGIGAPQHEAAFHWFKQSAESGYVPAQYSLGLRYLNGLGTSRSTRDAIDWLARAGDAQHAPSLHQLGDIYRTGEYMKPSPEWAIYYYEAAIKQGHTESQYELARMHLNSDEPQTNLIKAINLLVSAAKENHPGAQTLLEATVSDWETINIPSHEDFKIEVGEAHALADVTHHRLLAGPVVDGRRPAVCLHRLVSGSIVADTQPTLSAALTQHNPHSQNEVEVETQQVEQPIKPADTYSESVIVRRIGSEQPQAEVEHPHSLSETESKQDMAPTPQLAGDSKLKPGRYRVNRTVNLRKDAAAWSDRMGRLEAGEVITLLQDVGFGWAKVQVGEDIVHVMSRALELVE